VFEDIAGLVLGRSYGFSEEMTGKWETYAVEITEGKEFPVLSGVDVGHTDPLLTIFCESDLRDTLRTVFCEEHYRSDSELFKNPVIHGPIGYHFVQDCSTTATPITSDILLKF